MPKTKLLREHIYNNITQGCECELFAAKSPTMTKDEWAEHVDGLLPTASPVPAGRSRDQLAAIEHTRMSMGALLDSLTPGESSSRLGQRLDELHSELSAGLKALRGDGQAKYYFRGTPPDTDVHLDLATLSLVGHALDFQWTVERQLAGVWEKTKEMPMAGELA